MSPRTVIVGASVGGIRAAQALRAAGYSGTITVVDAENHLPYDKPPLSKGFLSGFLGPDRLQLISERDIKDLDIEIIFGHSAVLLDSAAREVELDGSSRLAYDNLVIATGVRARPSPWKATEGVHLLRTLDDANSLKRDLESVKSVVIVGAGFIGAEVAATAKSFGLEVTVVDPLPIPMARVLGDEVGKRFIGLHHANGVATHFGTGVDAITGSRGDLKVELSNGLLLNADIVVVGIGAVPNDEWLRSSGLLIENGLVCDEYCRAVGQSDIYGVGDVARWYHPRHDRLVRVEHWTNAVEQASCVAHNIVNPQDLKSYSPVEYVWSDQYDWKIQIAGITAEAANQIVIEDPSNPKRFAAIYSDHSGAFCGVATVSWPRALIECRKLLGMEKDISVPMASLERLLDASIK